MLGFGLLLDMFVTSWKLICGFSVVITLLLGYCLSSFTLYTRLIVLDTAFSLFIIALQFSCIIFCPPPLCFIIVSLCICI